MPILEPTIERRGNYMGVPIKRVSWSSIVCGVMVGLASFATLSMLGIAVGLIESEASSLPGVLGGISWAIIGALSLFVSGWTAGRLSGLRRRLEGLLHGFVTWGVASVLLLTFAGSFSVAVYGMPGQPAMVPAYERGPMMPERRKSGALDRERMEIERQARKFLVREKLDLQKQQEVYDRVLPEIVALIDAIMYPDFKKERERVIDTFVESTYIERKAIEKEVDHWVAIASRGVDKRRHKKRKAGKRIGKRTKAERMRGPGPTISVGPRAMAAWSFLFAALGAAAAMLGGWLGTLTLNGKPRGEKTIVEEEYPETD